MTKTKYFLSAVLFASTMHVPTGAVLAEELKSDDAHMAGFKMNKTTGRIVAQPLDLVADQANGHINTREDGRPTTNIYSMLTKDWHVVLTLEMSGFADDSVKGERTRWILEQLPDNTMKVLKSGVQYSCWRGSTPNTWVSGLCP